MKNLKINKILLILFVSQSLIGCSKSIDNPELILSLECWNEVVWHKCNITKHWWEKCDKWSCDD